MDIWSGAVRSVPAAQRPVAPVVAPGTFQFNYDPDTGSLTLWTGDGWVNAGASYQATPVAKTAGATLTATEIQNGIVTVTSASAVAITLTAGATLDAAIAGGNAPVGYAFEWSIINLGSASGAVTLTPSTGHTIVGGTTVAISTSFLYRTVKTADDTFVTYRIT